MSHKANVKVYYASKGTKTENGRVNKDRIYLIITDIKPSDRKDIKYKGNGFYELTDHLKKATALDLVTEWSIEEIANGLNRPYDEVANFRVDYLSTDNNGCFKIALAAEHKIWRNRKKNNRTEQAEEDEDYWSQNAERGSIPKSERGWVDETSAELGLDPEDWYWNIN